MIEAAKPFSYNQDFIPTLQVMSPAPWVIYMYKIMESLNNFTSETTWPGFTKFHMAILVNGRW